MNGFALLREERRKNNDCNLAARSLPQPRELNSLLCFLLSATVLPFLRSIRFIGQNQFHMKISILQCRILDPWLGLARSTPINCSSWKKKWTSTVEKYFISVCPLSLFLSSLRVMLSQWNSCMCTYLGCLGIIAKKWRCFSSFHIDD